MSASSLDELRGRQSPFPTDVEAAHVHRRGGLSHVRREWASIRAERDQFPGGAVADVDARDASPVPREHDPVEIARSAAYRRWEIVLFLAHQRRRAQADVDAIEVAEAIDV